MIIMISLNNIWLIIILRILYQQKGLLNDEIQCYQRWFRQDFK